jgi:uncharacterized protein
MIARDNYLNQLISFKDKELIKIVTGIRRCGKSTLFELYIDYLLKNGVNKNQIIHINLEEYEFDDITDYKLLYQYIDSKLFKDKNNYVFIDEVQRVSDFQKACDSLYINKNVDLYINGSNSKILSGELATLLSGRYIEIKMLPLSFKEYISYVGESDIQKKYVNYLTNSSFPYALKLDNYKDVRMYLDGIYNTIIVNDIAERKEISDIGMLKDIIKFMFDNIGNLYSSTNIANTMTSNGRKVSVPTVEKYLESLVESFVLYKVSRYDVKGKNLLTSGSKYYVVDLGLRYYLLGSSNADQGHILENIVYLELIRRGYEVYVGKNGDSEVDFVAINEYGTEYYQVSYSVKEEKTLNRELSALDSINDHNPKYLLTTDFTPYTSYNGIKQLNVFDWLLK